MLSYGFRVQVPESEFAGAIMPDHVTYGRRHGNATSETENSSLKRGEQACRTCFRKWVRLESNAIVLRYEIASTGVEGICALVVCSPLLAVGPGCRIVLPNEVSRVFVSWSREERLGRCGDNCGWPRARTREAMRSILRS